MRWYLIQDRRWTGAYSPRVPKDVVSARNAVALTVAVLIFGASLVFGFAGTAHAHGTWTPPLVPHSRVHTQGPFSALHRQGPFSILHQVG
jgi:hypothetical protein